MKPLRRWTIAHSAAALVILILLVSRLSVFEIEHDPAPIDVITAAVQEDNTPSPLKITFCATHADHHGYAYPPELLRVGAPSSGRHADPNNCACTSSELRWLGECGLEASNSFLAARSPTPRRLLGAFVTIVSGSPASAFELLLSAASWNKHLCSVMPYDFLVFHEALTPAVITDTRNTLVGCRSVSFISLRYSPPSDYASMCCVLLP
jgi:hypothetical protein